MTPEQEEAAQIARFDLSHLKGSDLDMLANALDVYALSMRNLGEMFMQAGRQAIAQYIWNKAKRAEQLSIMFNTAVGK